MFLGIKQSKNTARDSLIEILRAKAENEMTIKSRELDLEERKIALEERKLALQERKLQLAEQTKKNELDVIGDNF